MLSSIVTGAIITKYEAAFATLPILVSFIPMIMGTGGNCGSQSATLVIRGLALNEISIKDYFKVAFKEFKVSLIVSIILSVVNLKKTFKLSKKQQRVPGDDVVVSSANIPEGKTASELKEENITKHSPYLFTKKLEKKTIKILS